jgi:translation elongation factor EF-Ts
MSERTVITTIEITDIYKNVPEDKELKTTKYVEDIKQAVKDVIDADDVVVTNVQEFVLGDEE